MEVFAFVLYLLAVLGIGIFFFVRSKQSSEKDYFLGGRQMGPFVTAMSAQASDMSGWLLMGFPGSILAFGLGQAWIGIGLAIGTALNWLLVAKRLRLFSRAANDSITLPQYLSNRFMTGSPVLQVICAVIFLVFFTLYVASGFIAGATVFSNLFEGLDKALALVIFAGIILLYTFLGGFNAVCWTDFVQGVMMLVALLAVPIIMLASGDVNMEKAELLHITDGFTMNPFTASPAEITSGLAWGLGYFGMPHILVRFMSIKSHKRIKTSAAVAIAWVLLTLGAAILMAYFARSFFHEGVPFWVALQASGGQEQIFIELVRILFPGFIAGILLSAIIAAAMSTADSQLLVASSSFTSDIYRPLIRKNASEREYLMVGRIVVVAVSIVACVIAYFTMDGESAIMSMVDNAWGGFGASFGPVIILSLYWRRLTYKGAIAGVLAGAVTDIAWLFILTDKTGIYELLPGFVVGMLACVLVSLIDKKPAKEIDELFDTAISAKLEEE